MFFFFKAVGRLSSCVFTAFEKRFSETSKTNCTSYLTTKVFYYTNLDLQTLFGLSLDLSVVYNSFGLSTFTAVLRQATKCFTLHHIFFK